MSGVLPLLLGCSLLAPAADPDKPTTWRYVRPDGGKFVFDGELTFTRSADGSSAVSRVDRGKETLTLTVERDKAGQVVAANAVDQTADDKKAVTVTFVGKSAEVRRGGLREYVETPADAVVATAPGLGDVLQLVRRYDAAKGGKQEFPGLWIHPREPYATLTFVIERVGGDKATLKDKEVALDRYRVKRRDGTYLVWASADGVVYKVAPDGGKGDAAVLEGWEDATRDLK